MQKEVVVALVAATASIIVAVFSAIADIWSSRQVRKASTELELVKANFGGDLERLKRKLTEKAGDRDARRDYEYDGRKPSLF